LASTAIPIHTNILEHGITRHLEFDASDIFLMLAGEVGAAKQCSHHQLQPELMTKLLQRPIPVMPKLR
jgi:hypothetical protein